MQDALIGSVSSEELNENMRYYEEYIHSQVRSGKTEQEVLNELGDPRLIAKTIIDTSAFRGGDPRAAYAEAEFMEAAENAEEVSRGSNVYEERRRDEAAPEEGRQFRVFTGLKAYLMLFAVLAVIIGVIVLAANLIVLFLPVILVLMLVYYFTRPRY